MTSDERHQEFETLIEGHRKILYKVCNAYCPVREDREDLAQEMLAQLWRTFGRFDRRSSFATWMYRVALNTAISFVRGELKRKRTATQADEGILLTTPRMESNDDDLQLLHQLIATLDPLNKALILLYLDGHSSPEISEILGISATNVATKINRLKESLKTKAAGMQRQGQEILNDNSR